LASGSLERSGNEAEGEPAHGLVVLVGGLAAPPEIEDLGLRGVARRRRSRARRSGDPRREWLGVAVWPVDASELGGLAHRLDEGGASGTLAAGEVGQEIPAATAREALPEQGPAVDYENRGVVGPVEGAASTPLAPEAVLELDVPIGDLGPERDELRKHHASPESHGVEPVHHDGIHWS
jgi:hypothetical protein